MLSPRMYETNLKGPVPTAAGPAELKASEEGGVPMSEQPSLLNFVDCPPLAEAEMIPQVDNSVGNKGYGVAVLTIKV